MSTPSPKLDLDEMMGRLRSGSRPGELGAIDVHPPGFKGSHATIDCEQSTVPSSAGQLLSLPETEFVRACYLAFLGREARPVELATQRDRLLSWQASRLRIVRELRASAEGRAYRGQLEGLWKILAWDRLYWSPPAKMVRSIARAIIFIRGFQDRFETMERANAHTAAHLARLQQELARDRHTSTNQIRHMQERMSAIRQLADDVRATLTRRAEAIERQLANSTTQLGLQMGQLEHESAELQTELKTRLVDHWRAIVDQKFQIQSLYSAAPVARANREIAAKADGREESDLLDALYLSFEDRYRGTRQQVKERQAVYLPYVEDCIRVIGGIVLDIGCGRGEWLELLRDAGIAARGADLNRIAVEECRARNLDVHLEDGIDALRNVNDSSLGVITSFHVIEHLPFELLVSLLDHALRTLQPGGLLILETPNPANLLVAAERFYFDPTHRNPLPSELVSYLVKSRGFERAEFLPLHPVQRDDNRRYEDPLLELLQEKFFGPQDYGVIGWKAE